MIQKNSDRYNILKGAIFIGYRTYTLKSSYKKVNPGNTFYPPEIAAILDNTAFIESTRYGFGLSD